MHRTRIILITLLLAAWVGAPPASAQETISNPALATRMETLARRTLAGDAPTPAAYRAAAALLEAASRLDPREPRYQRLRADALRRAGDEQGAIAALTAYRTLDDKDEWAQVDQIDLYLSQMKTADAQERYLRQVVETPSLPPAVRSYAAARAARVLHERSQPGAAASMVATALELNPLNVDALHQRLAGLSDDQPVDRLTTLLALLRADPAQPIVMADVARVLADAGLVNDALDWYLKSLSYQSQTGVAPPHQELVDYLAQLLIANRPDATVSVVDQMLQADPHDTDALFIKLLAARMSEDAHDVEPLLDNVQSALMERWSALVSEATDPAATQPAEPLEPAAVLWQIQGQGRDDLLDRFLSLAGDMAWFRIYFQSRPGDAEAWIAALETVLPESSPTLARLRGWQLLRQGDLEQAGQRLGAVADTDPIAALGLVLLHRASEAPDEQVRDESLALLRAHRAGLVGATIHESLRPLDLSAPADDDAAALRQALGAFPMNWFDVLAQPQGIYTMRVEPTKVTHAFGEPVLLEVRLYNASDFTLALGPDGVLQRDLWIDAQVRGVEQPMSGVAFDYITGPLVLLPRRALTQRIRVDQGDLDQVLLQNPMAMVQAEFTVVTNPLPGAQGIMAGPAGYAARSARPVQRPGTVVRSSDDLATLRAAFAAGGDEQKIDILSLLAALVANLRNQNAGPDLQPVPGQMLDWLRHAATSPDPNVAAWAAYQRVQLSPPAEAPAAITDMAGRNGWIWKILALTASRAYPETTALSRDLAASTDDPLVKRYAAAVEELIQAAPTTAPTTAPATAPTTAPAQ